MTREALIAEWVTMARELGQRHACGAGSDDNPIDAIDLQAWDDLTGGGMSMMEMIDIQAELEAAYEESLRVNGIGAAWVTDLDSASGIGEVYKLVAFFPAPDGADKAAEFLETLEPADVARGRYAIDVNQGEGG